MKKIAYMLGAMSILGLAGAANAGVIYDFTGGGTSASYPVSATAKFNVSAGSISLSLTNTTPHTHDAGQLLTGIIFSLKNGNVVVSNGTGFTAQAAQRTVAGNGSYTNSSVTAVSWESTYSSGLYQFDFNPTAKDSIIGPADGETSTPLSGTYTGDGSINGNPGHNPFVGETATFTLSSANITTGTVVGDVTFIYNTALSKTFGGPPNSVPEPASLGVLGLGVAGLMFRRRKA